MSRRTRIRTHRRRQAAVQVPLAEIPWDDPRFKRLTLLFLALFIIMALLAAALGLYLVAAAVMVFGLVLFALFGRSQIRGLWAWLHGGGVR